MASLPTSSVAFNWLEALQKKTIKNISHLEFLSKYSGFRTNIDQCVLLLQGLRFRQREFFLIRVLGALYEPFAGPHYVQIADGAPFWVHSLTAFRREFFGLTDKLSFERSVFVGLSDGEIVRLKIIRPYIFIPHELAIPEGSLIKIMKTPTSFFFVNNRTMMKHKEEVAAKKAEAAAQRAAVRERVRKHLVSTVQQLFCSYTRDTHIDIASAAEWFRVDMKYAMDTCEMMYPHLARVRPERDVHDAINEIAGHLRPRVAMASSEEDVSVLRRHMSMVDTQVAEVLRSLREGATSTHMTTDRVEANVRAMLSMPPPMVATEEGVLMDAYYEDKEAQEEYDQEDDEE
jgi:hypothetical protein